MDILVSVCITTYNVEDYIPQTIESVLMQKTTFPFEIIIGDDASSDHTRQVCLSYQEKYPDKIKLVLHDKNVGVGDNNFAVIQQAQGQYIAWCDGDDYWIDEYKLQYQYEILEKFSDVSLVHTDWLNIRDFNDTKNESKITQNEIERFKQGIECIEMLILKRDSGCRFSSCMFRKVYYMDAATKHPALFFSERNCSDFSIFVAMYARGRFYHLPVVSTAYRIRKESLSFTQNKEKRYLYNLGYYRLIVFIIKTYRLSANVRDIALKRELNELLKYTFFHQRKQDAVELKSLATTAGYKLSFIQNILYRGSFNKILYLILHPLLSIVLKY